MELRGKSRSNPVRSDEINDSRLHFDFKDQETACVSLVPSWRANFSHTSCWVRLNSYHMIISNDFLIMTTKKACTCQIVSFDDKRCRICRAWAPICWWEKLLVVILEHSTGIKHTILLQKTKAYNNTKLTIYTLFFSFFFSIQII